MHPEPLAPVLPGHRVLDELVLLEVLGLAAGPEAGRPHLHAVLRALVPRELLEDRPSIILGRQAQQEASSLMMLATVCRQEPVALLCSYSNSGVPFIIQAVVLPIVGSEPPRADDLLTTITP